MNLIAKIVLVEVDLHDTSPSVTAFGDKTLGGYRSGVVGFHVHTGINLKISNADNISQIKGTAFSSGFNLGKGIDLGFEITSSIRSKYKCSMNLNWIKYEYFKSHQKIY